MKAFFSPNSLVFHPQKTTNQKLFSRITIILVVFFMHWEYTPILESLLIFNLV